MTRKMYDHTDDDDWLDEIDEQLDDDVDWEYEEEEFETDRK